jgi:mono/diheme cytochrome c family protein
MSALLLTFLLACGGEEKKPEPAKPAEPPKAAAPAPPPPVAPTPAPAPAPTGPYTPDEFAKAAYDKAKAEGADKIDKNPKAGDAAAIAAGKSTFDGKCMSCHGATGAGDGIAGAALPQKPANFHHKERWEATNVGVKHWVVKHGVEKTAMAPLALTDDQAWEVLAYIEATFAGK